MVVVNRLQNSKEAMENFSGPGPLPMQGNMAENWKRWKQRFMVYLKASAMDKETQERQVCVLLHFIGNEALDIYNSFSFMKEEEKDELAIVLNKFEEHFLPKKNLSYERHVFFSRVQKVGESIEQFVTDLRLKSQSCEFEALKDSLITDRIVCGVLDPHLRERLLRENDLTLDRAIAICKVTELSQQQIQKLQDTEGAVVQVVRSNREQKKSKEEQRMKPNKQLKSSKCTRCGKHHQWGNCPAYGKVCHKCHKNNHFASQCRQKAVNIVRKLKTESSDTEQMLFVGCLNIQKYGDGWMETVLINGKPVNFKLDTGAQTNILPIQYFQHLQIRKSKIEDTKIKLSTYSGERLPVCGQCTINCVVRDQKMQLNFIVVDMDSQPVLGVGTCQELSLIKRVMSTTQPNLKEDPGLFIKYKDLFDGKLGLMPTRIHITLKENVQPVVEALRKVPMALEGKLKNEPGGLEQMRVIERVTEPTDWVNSIVIVQKKNGNLRICLDPRNLNAAIKRSHYPLPSFDQIVAKLNGAQHFTILDASSGFWMVELDAESAKLCTFQTPFGRYRFLRLPFGLSIAPEIFHRIVAQTFDGLDGVESYIDDIIVWGKDKEEHDRNLEKVLQVARAAGFKFNKDKCQYNVQEVTYLGHKIGTNGIKIDEDKVKAVANMPTPQNKKELERFLGMTNYVAKFVKDFSTITAPLRILLKKEIAWHWNEQQETAYATLKKMISTAPVLSYYDVTQPVTLATDASSVGLGAVLSQNGKPIAYASKAMTEAQMKYAQIEKEMLAITFGCERFKQYLYGRPFVVETDHKPLTSLFKKPLNEVPVRIQRMMLRVQTYDLKVIYTPGKELVVADALSRATMTDTEKEDTLNIEEDIELQINMLVENLPVSAEKREQLQKETEKDVALCKVRDYIRKGWPDHKKQLDVITRPYWNFREELFIVGGLILKNTAIVIPTVMQGEMLKLIHQGHMGIERCKGRARGILYWVGMNHDIEKMVNDCTTCQKYRKNNVPEPLIPHEIPELPWEKVGVDVYDYKRKSYVLVVDYYSNYIETQYLPDMKSETMVNILKSIFARHGIPQKVITDNAKQFVCDTVRRFSKEWKFIHITSSPYYPKSNGLAERGVQTIKNILYKAEQSGEDPYLALLNYRNTRRGHIDSPAQLLMSRSLNCQLPLTKQMLKPSISVGVSTKIKQQRAKSKKWYDRQKRPLRPLEVGEEVMFKKKIDQNWEPGTITAKVDSPRSYLIDDPTGKQYRRNRFHIYPKSKFKPVPAEVVADSERNEEEPKIAKQNVELQFMKNLDKYVTNRGRVVHAPKRFGFE